MHTTWHPFGTALIFSLRIKVFLRFPERGEKKGIDP